MFSIEASRKGLAKLELGSETFFLVGGCYYCRKKKREKKKLFRVHESKQNKLNAQINYVHVMYIHVCNVHTSVAAGENQKTRIKKIRGKGANC